MISFAVHGLREAERGIAAQAKAIKATRRPAMRAAVSIYKRAALAAMTGPKKRDPFWGVISTGADSHQITVRSGDTRKALSSSGSNVYAIGDVVVGVVGTDRQHMLLLESGGTKHGTSPKGFLRIPTAAAQTKAGDEAGRFKGRSLRDVDGVGIRPAGADRLWAYDKASKALLFLLVKFVVIQGRGLFGSVFKRFQRIAIEAYHKTMVSRLDATGSANGGKRR